jgi:CYTH domain-containing protein
VLTSLKYAVVERERRFLIRSTPSDIVETVEIVDLYVDGSRLRLREVRNADGSVVRKLTHKVRLADNTSEVACTNFYLDDAEWHLLTSALTGKHLYKTRHKVLRDGLAVVIDVHEGGAIIAEIDDGDSAPEPVPVWLDVIREVTHDESWTGAGLAR